MPDTHEIDVREIMKYIPHRYPFLLVDRVKNFVPGDSLEAIKNVTINEPQFQGHFPGLPVMPGVLVVEALAQAGGILVFKSFDLDLTDKVFLFSGIDKVRFRRPVMPGDQLVLKLTELKSKMMLYRMKGTAYVEGDIAVEAQMTAALVDKEDIG
jgi:3-hydroxyacyl-[acyl-carrier-protein] dehydratase